MSDTLSCSLNRSWVLKIGVFMVFALGFGILSLFDAVWAYPARGLADASYKLRDFLKQADHAGFNRPDRIATPDPKQELARLRTKIEDLRGAATGTSGEAQQAAMEVAKYEWLSSLDRCWELNTKPKPLGEFATPVKHSVWLDPAKGEGYTIGADGAKAALTPPALLDELVKYWSAAQQPSALPAWDLPMQWLFVIVGFGVGGYLAWLMLKCRGLARRTTFEPGTQRLSLPSGASFTPAELEDVDKRLWHKFFVTMATTDGKHHKLDLLRYVPLEEWVLGMEATKFPERAAEEAKREEEERKAAEEAERAKGGAADGEAVGGGGEETAAEPAGNSPEQNPNT